MIAICDLPEPPSSPDRYASLTWPCPAIAAAARARDYRKGQQHSPSVDVMCLCISTPLRRVVFGATSCLA